MKQVQTLTLNEMIELFRECGIPCSYYKASALIMQDKLPFASGVELPSGQKEYLIFRNGCIKWLKEKGEES